MARGKPFAKGTPRPANAGRRAGTPNKLTKAFKDTLAAVLEDSETETRLRELRDADNPIDRSTFWRMAGKFVPQKIEADLTGEVTLRIVDRSDARREG